jgi:hypothetical protein
VSFVAQQRDDFVIVMLDRQLSNAFNERGRITDCISPLWRQLDAQGFDFAALPTDVQSDPT